MSDCHHPITNGERRYRRSPAGFIQTRTEIYSWLTSVTPWSGLASAISLAVLAVASGSLLDLDLLCDPLAAGVDDAFGFDRGADGRIAARDAGRRGDRELDAVHRPGAAVYALQPALDFPALLGNRGADRRDGDWGGGRWDWRARRWDWGVSRLRRACRHDRRAGRWDRRSRGRNRRRGRRD